MLFAERIDRTAATTVTDMTIMIALGNSGTVGDDVGLIEAVGLLEDPEADVADLSTVASNV